MSSTLQSAATFGFNVSLIDVEVDLSRGLPHFSIVGMGDTAIQESKERIRSAMKNSGYAFHDGRITVNLAPASQRKEGASLDCAIAVGILLEQQALTTSLKHWLVIGELALNGTVRPIAGAINIALLAREQGVKTIIVPAKNLEEVRVVDGVRFIGVSCFADVANALAKPEDAEVIEGSSSFLSSYAKDSEQASVFDDIRGHEHAKRALAIAAAGNHHVLLYGPPGSGKSVLAASIRSLLPEMSEEEVIETTRVYSASGELSAEKPLIVERPFRAPHHTSTAAAVLGGSTPPRPGELSLAHNGVLFFDEVLEFQRSVLEGLRQPLEAQQVTISRSQYRCTFPARILFIGAFNPCPCGYATDPERECICSSYQRVMYAKRLSGPIKDRCDLFIHVERQDIDLKERSSDKSSNLRERVLAARELQKKRFKDCEHSFNSEMSLKFISANLAIHANAHQCMQLAARRLHLSPRAYLKVVRTAQTIADLAECNELRKEHILEALQFRATDLL